MMFEGKKTWYSLKLPDLNTLMECFSQAEAYHWQPQNAVLHEASLFAHAALAERELCATRLSKKFQSHLLMHCGNFAAICGNAEYDAGQSMLSFNKPLILAHHVALGEAAYQEILTKQPKHAFFGLGDTPRNLKMNEMFTTFLSHKEEAWPFDAWVIQRNDHYFLVCAICEHDSKFKAIYLDIDLV